MLISSKLKLINPLKKYVNQSKLTSFETKNIDILYKVRMIEIKQCTKFLLSPSYSYVKIKDIQQIKQQYKQKGMIKIITKSCSFYMKQAWNDFKKDYQTFKQIKSIPNHQRSQQQKQLYRKIKIDMIKFGPAFAIFNIPFGFPLFYLYLTLFPQLIPSWMMVDSINEKIMQQRQERRIDAWKYYVKKFNNDVRMAYLKEAIFKSNQSLDDMRRISCLCYGDYIDGTQYISSKLKVKIKNGLVLPKLSLFLLKINLENQLNHDYLLQNDLKSYKTFQQKLFYKLEKQIQNLPE